MACMYVCTYYTYVYVQYIHTYFHQSDMFLVLEFGGRTEVLLSLLARREKGRRLGTLEVYNLTRPTRLKHVISSRALYLDFQHLIPFFTLGDSHVQLVTVGLLFLFACIS